LLPPKPSK